MPLLWYVGNDNPVRFRAGMTFSVATGETFPLDSGATVTFRIQTPEHVDVAGETWPQTMTYIGETEEFVGVVRETVALEAGHEYRFVPTADNGVDQHATWDIQAFAVLRTS